MKREAPEPTEGEPMPPALAKLVAPMRADVLDPAMVAEISRRVMAQTGGGGSPPQRAKGRGTIAAGATVTVAGVLALLFFWPGSAPEPVAGRLPDAPRIEPVPTVTSVAPVPETAPTIEATEPEVTPAEVPDVAPEPATRAEREPAVPSEYELLAEARRVLESDPMRALALADTHRRAYRTGALAPEREMIAVDALTALGRERQARARARSLVLSWPTSAYADRVRSSGLLE